MHLLAYSDGALNLTGRHSLFCFTQKQRGHEPFRQRQVRIIENRASGHSELIVAILAVEQFLVGFEFYSSLFAARAFNAQRPTETAQHLAASFVSGELSAQVC